VAVVVVSPTRSSAALNNYVLNDKKDQKGERYVMASGLGGLLVSVAEKQMRDVRKKYNKDKPGAYVQAYHVIQSFGKDELEPADPDSWLTAQKLGRALSEDRFPGRQVLVVTQRDGKTGCIHNHIVVNSVETKTGKSLNSSVVTHSRLVQEHDRVLVEQGFEQRADLKQAASDAKERFKLKEPSRMRRKGETDTRALRELQRYIVWETECDIADELGVARKSEPFSVAVLKHSITQALADPDASDWASFVAAGRKHGVDIAQRGQKGRGISYGMLREQPDGSLAEPTASDRRRSSSLGTGFLMDDVEWALERNSRDQQQQAQAAVSPPTDDEAQADAQTPGASEPRQAALTVPSSEPEKNEQTPDPEQAARVIINPSLAVYGDREADRVMMMINGMSDGEVSVAVASWESLGKPETAVERSARDASERWAARPALADIRRSQELEEVPEGTDAETLSETPAAVEQVPTLSRQVDSEDRHRAAERKRMQRIRAELAAQGDDAVERTVDEPDLGS
jgi:hypothetical protein